ncbi:uncharacterized protein LOC143195164 [Rhynchophorus ferrugineus]|uniref:uncharacterized protein LOC143195164 n=1 Tax=Rhynchophorus ferrugineus TaxID=354439 RepID=UPI003FCEC374
MSTLDENLPVRNIEEVVCSFGGTLKQEQEEEDPERNLSGKIAFHGSGNARGIIPCVLTPPVREPVAPIETGTLQENGSFPRREIVKIAGVRCDFCQKLDHQGTVELHTFEKALALIALKKLRPLLRIDQKSITADYKIRRLCGPCFKNLYVFRDRVKSFLERKRDEKKRRAMEGNDHGYQCRCPSCKSKYGALPVLLKGIEEQHKIESSQQVVDQSTVGQPYQAYMGFDYSPDVSVMTTHMVNDYSTPIHQTVKYETEIKTEPSVSQHSYQKQLPFYPMDDTYLIPQAFQTSNVDYSTPLKTDPFPSTSMEQCTTSHANELNDFDINLFDSSYEHPNIEKAPLPTMLKDLENQNLSLDQPSTSTGFSGHSQSDDKLPRRTMTCVHCGKKFTHKGDFNKHLRKHTKEKPYKCSFCQKPFSHTSNLHRHERIHSGDRPYKCEFCDKCFNRTDKLESHKNSKFCKNRRRYK